MLFFSINVQVEQKEKYLNKIEFDTGDNSHNKNKSSKKSKTHDSESDMDIEEEDNNSNTSESEEKTVKMPKLGKKTVDNFFVAPSTKVDKNQAVKIVGKNGRVLKTITEVKKKTLSDSDTDTSDDSD